MHELGLEDRPNGDQNLMCEEFEEQLVRSPEDGTKPVYSRRETIHKQESLKRLDHLMRKLEKQPRMLQKYENIIQDARNNGTSAQGTRRKRVLPSKQSHRAGDSRVR